ncbi:hypothetical protein [Klebsiella michiganensis]|uniref:hypothetical protein n=1 Tax=Klebsiella michiganensis TaxID=1134687 RepID=UPI00254FD6B2|nr:hypothetical protein [Klebsiella michiganensis]MDK9838545.1 hypothetical protein [Klebsiella michiganensis]
MNGIQTKNAALTTALAFHYQVLIGLDKCFSLQDEQSIWFEKDGDISLVSNKIDESTQTEAKNYAAPLTDHHENLWNTLKNWLDAHFKHENYGFLILHTTQAFGSTTRLAKWNSCSPEDRLQILKDIFSERSKEELELEKPKNIVKLQKAVMASPSDKLMEIIKKMSIFTEADDLEALKDKILKRPIGIPRYNLERYLEGLVGFVYEQANYSSWEISSKLFNAKCEELTSLFHKKEFTFPQFNGYEPTELEIEKYQEKLFVKKIIDIEHHAMIPDAIGNWVELQNSLIEELDEYPLYAKKTKAYQKQIIKRFFINYSSAQINIKDQLKDSKILYNNTINEIPFNMGNDIPPIEYKNGLIHDAMDDDDKNIKWKIEP